MPFRSVAEQHLSDLIDLFQSILTGNTELSVGIDLCVLKEQKGGLSYKSLLRCLLSFPGHKDDRTVIIFSEQDTFPSQGLCDLHHRVPLLTDPRELFVEDRKLLLRKLDSAGSLLLYFLSA